VSDDETVVVRDVRQIALLSGLSFGLGVFTIWWAWPELPSLAAWFFIAWGVCWIALALRIPGTAIVVRRDDVVVRGIWKTVRCRRSEVVSVGFRPGSHFNASSVCVCVVTASGSRLGPATLATTRRSEKAKYWLYVLSSALNVPIDEE
jgi:hypothetical protein